MYAQTQTIPAGMVLAGFLIAGLLAGGAGGYAIAVARTPIAAPATLTGSDTSGYDERVTAFLVGEHQGSPENPDATHGPTNTTFLAGEHQGSDENPTR